VRLSSYVHMNETILAERREGRRVCPKCGLTYNLNPISHDGYHLKARAPHGDNETCDVDGTRLERREDDAPEIANKRMAAFHQLSLPMAEFYEQKGKLISIEKTRGAAALFKIIRPQIEELMDKQDEDERKHPREARTQQPQEDSHQQNTQEQDNEKK
jgi:adenylate kinase family enzyme